MPNERDIERDNYIFRERYKGRTLKSIAEELGIGVERVRQIYARGCKERRQKYFRKHPEAYIEWHTNPNETGEKFLEAYMKEFEGEIIKEKQG